MRREPVFAGVTSSFGGEAGRTHERFLYNGTFLLLRGAGDFERERDLEYLRYLGILSLRFERDCFRRGFSRLCECGFRTGEEGSVFMIMMATSRCLVRNVCESQQS